MGLTVGAHSRLQHQEPISRGIHVVDDDHGDEDMEEVDQFSIFALERFSCQRASS